MGIFITHLLWYRYLFDSLTLLRLFFFFLNPWRCYLDALIAFLYTYLLFLLYPLSAKIKKIFSHKLASSIHHYNLHLSSVVYIYRFLPIMVSYNPKLGQKKLTLRGRKVFIDPPPGVLISIFKSRPLSIESI